MNSVRPIIWIAESNDFSLEVIRYLESFAEVNLQAVDHTNLKEALEQCDIFWMRLGYQINSNVLTTNSRCKIIAVPATGIDHIDEKLCAELGVKVLSLRGERKFLKEVRATAELTIGLALALMRHIPHAYQSVRSGEWNRDQFRGNEIYKKTVGIIGLGRLGEIVGNYFLAMGMKVIAYDIRDEPKLLKQFEFKDSIETVVEKADLISLHVNYSPENHQLINEYIISKFKEGAYFINTSRGGLVDEHALLNRLQTGKLKGAALDVLWGEPNIENHPLVLYAKQNSNLLLVPHIGGNTFESFEKTERFIAEKINLEVTQWQY